MSRSRRLLGVILANLARSRNHFLLASIGVVVGIATFTFFMALGLGVREIVLGKIFPLDQLEVTTKSLDVDLGPLRLGLGRDVIDDTKVEQLEAIPGVTHVYPKMKLTVPSTGVGGESILGSDIRSEMIVDGIEPALVEGELEGGYAFRDYDAEATSALESCTLDDDCGEGRYCGVPQGTLLPANTTERLAALQATPRVCRAYVPVLVSNHVIELYNGALRRAHGFPKLNPRAVLGFTFDLTVGASMVRASERDRVVLERAKLSGFTNKAIPLGVTLPLGYVRRYNVLFGSPQDATRYHSAIVMVPKKSDVAAVAKAVDELGLAVEDSGAEQAALLIAIVMAVLGLVSAVIVGIAAINIMHVFFMLVYERQHEIGVMRAVGARRSDVARIILGEAGMLGSLCGVVGCALALAAAALCDWVSSRYIPDFPYKPTSYFEFPWWLLVAALAFAAGFCILGAFLPARRAARMEPAAVLSGH